MKDFVKFVGWEWLTPDNKKIVIRDEKGRHFICSRLSFVAGETFYIEYGEDPKTGYFEIYRVIERIPLKNKKTI